MSKTPTQITIEKMNKAESGKRIITNSKEINAMLLLDEKFYNLKSIPNPNRCGLLDQYIAYF